MRIFLSKSALSFDRLRSLPRETTDTAWSGESLGGSFEWTLARDNSSLWFAVEVPGAPTFDPVHRKGAFVEGLWLRDVAELFLADGSGHYQEFNISPKGAWWGCLFSSYRARSTSQRPPETTLVDTDVQADRWAAMFAVRLDELAIEFGAGLSVHVSAIRYRPEQLYLSSAPVAGVEADFHLAECFSPVTFVQLDDEPPPPDDDELLRFTGL